MDLNQAKDVLLWLVVLLGGGGAATMAARRGLAKTRDVETDGNSKRDFMATILADGKDARERTTKLNEELQEKMEENGKLLGQVNYLERRVKDLEEEVQRISEDRDRLETRLGDQDKKLNRLLRKYGTDTDFAP